MVRVALLAATLVSPAAYEPIPNPDACAASITAMHDTSEVLGETGDGIEFLLRRPRVEASRLAEAFGRAEQLIDDGQRNLETLISACGGGVLDWATDLRAAMGDLRSSMEVGRLRRPDLALPRAAAGEDRRLMPVGSTLPIRPGRP